MIKEYNIKKMSLFELSRWFSLLECMDIIDEKCIERDIKPGDINIPHACLLEYIEGTHETHINKLMRNINTRNINTEIDFFHG